MSARKTIYIIFGFLSFISVSLSVLIFFEIIPLSKMSLLNRKLKDNGNFQAVQENIPSISTNTNEKENFSPDYIENPEQNGFVTDLADLISKDKEKEIIEMLEDYEKRTTNEIIVLTVKSTGGETIDSYANRIFKKWGPSDKDNAILILVTNRASRIEVGYGLEDKITNEIAYKILHEKFLPLFKPEDISDGIIEGIRALIKQIEEG